MFDISQLWRWLLGSPADSAEPDAELDTDALERPWLSRWDHLPKRTAGSDFSRADYRAARRRAIEVAQTTLGDERWADLQRDGHLDVPSRLFRGVTYRLRVGRRIEVRCAPGV